MKRFFDQAGMITGLLWLLIPECPETHIVNKSLLELFLAAQMLYCICVAVERTKRRKHYE
jgi:hypothetical protein